MSDDQLNRVLTVVMASIILLFILLFAKFTLDYRVRERELKLEERSQRQIEQLREDVGPYQDGLP